ncbi:MAG: hypothetical protein NZO16_04225 [Deltaproteobacteria bacterium]|nr:hypothetical protein [Deltaproteobacteria bacterium]
MLKTISWLLSWPLTVFECHFRAFGFDKNVRSFWEEFAYRCLFSVLRPVTYPKFDLIVNSCRNENCKILLLTYHSAYLAAIFKWASSIRKKINILVRPPRSLILNVIYKIVELFFPVKFLNRFNLLGIKDSEVLVALLDQDTKTKGRFINFWGLLAKTPATLFKIAKKEKFTIYFLKFTRSDASIELTFIKLPELDDDFKAATEYNTLLEDAIRNDISSWCWFHKRWRTRPDKMLSHEEYIDFFNSFRLF